MKTLSAALALSAGLIAALWWSVQPPALAPQQAGPLREQRQAQCPENSVLNGKQCVCAAGTAWDGANCSRAVPVAHTGAAPADDGVNFARRRVPSLPPGLESWKGKLDIVNSTRPAPGSVALIHVAAGAQQEVGQLAIVEAVTATSLTILEGNRAGTMTRRSASGRDLAEAERQLSIVGYFRPNS